LANLAEKETIREDFQNMENGTDDVMTDSRVHQVELVHQVINFTSKLVELVYLNIENFML
jgi:hypothetical protein